MGISYNLKKTRRFSREYKKISKKNISLGKKIFNALELLCIDPFDSKLRTHRVNIPDLGRVYSSRVSGDVRIVWSLEGKNEIVLYRVGGHSGSKNVYRDRLY